jgi:glycosyltransferase involved in cell wall biosynthesis
MTRSAESDVALAFVGTLVPDCPPFWNEACNRAGNMFQERLLLALDEAGLPACLILSQRPVRLFPRSRTLVVRGSRHEMESGLSIELLPYVNLPVIRPIGVGLIVLSRIMRWRAPRGVKRAVLTYNLTEPPGLFTLIASRLSGASPIASVNDIFVPGETIADSWSRRLDFWLQSRLIPRFDGLSVASRRIAEQFAPKTPWVRNEGGVGDTVVSRFEQRPSVPASTVDRPFTIVFAGSFTKINGIPEIVAAFAQLDGREIRLLVAGRGPEEEVVQRAAAGDARIDFRGYLSENEVLELYGEADLLLNLRITERVNTDYFFPSKLVEYLATGVPVLSTGTGHVQEEFGEVLFLLEEESPEALAAALTQLAAMDPRARWARGAAARKQVLSTHQWSVQGQKLADFIRQIAERG